MDFSLRFSLSLSSPPLFPSGLSSPFSFGCFRFSFAAVHFKKEYTVEYHHHHYCSILTLICSKEFRVQELLLFHSSSTFHSFLPLIFLLPLLSFGTWVQLLSYSYIMSSSLLYRVNFMDTLFTWSKFEKSLKKKYIFCCKKRGRDSESSSLSVKREEAKSTEKWGKDRIGAREQKALTLGIENFYNIKVLFSFCWSSCYSPLSPSCYSEWWLQSLIIFGILKLPLFLVLSQFLGSYYK